jgi:hypothetical protein
MTAYNFRLAQKYISINKQKLRTHSIYRIVISLELENITQDISAILIYALYRKKENVTQNL